MLVIIFSIDPPSHPFPNFPGIKIELFRGSPPTHPMQANSTAQERIATKVWSCDWTQAATPFYILLSDIFRGQPPANYGGNVDRVFLDTQAWRLAIINKYVMKL